MPEKPSSCLRQLALLRDRYGGGVASRKSRLLAVLEKSSLSKASEVFRLHEILCFLRAYPDDPHVLMQVERMLESFARRKDLRRQRVALSDTGIAGTQTRFRFFAPTAAWLAKRYPKRLHVDWKKLTRQERLESLLPLLVHYAETPGLDEWDLEVREWIRRLKGSDESDGAFLARRFDALKADSFVREKIYDDLDIPMCLDPGERTPSRSQARHPGSPVVFVRGDISRQRPVLPGDALRRPLAVRNLSRRSANGIIDLARAAMITRQRDLDLFSYASPDDVRLVEWGDGLQFACLGALPERRLLLEAVYAFLTLKNGVPIGYVLVSALFGSSEIAYNVFETYRGVEAGRIYGRVLATTRHLFGSDTFTIFPYQLGHENEEAIRSGAWWFYQKIGFEPRSREAVQIMRRELSRMKRDDGHRSSAETLRALAQHNLYYYLERPRSDVIGADFLPNVGMKISDYLAKRFGSDREEATRTCSREAASLLHAGLRRGFTPGERLAWERWAPLVCLLPGLSRWSTADKRSLVRVIQSKGGRRESEFAVRFDRHHRLREAMLRLTGHRRRS
jgi:hypothetical protein